MFDRAVPGRVWTRRAFAARHKEKSTVPRTLLRPWYQTQSEFGSFAGTRLLCSRLAIELQEILTIVLRRTPSLPSWHLRTLTHVKTKNGLPPSPAATK